MTRGKSHLMSGALLLLAACAQEPAEREAAPQETAEQTGVGDAVLPAEAATTYQTWSKQVAQPDLKRTAEADLEISFARRGKAALATAAGAGARNSAVVTLAESKPALRGDLPAGVSDLLALLPATGATLKVGEAYESSGPEDAYVFEQADLDRMVLWQPMLNEPVAIVREPGFTLVRVENRGVNRLYFVDDDGSIATTDLGPAFIGVTDLVKVEGRGWQVLRFVRFNEVAGADTAPELLAADARLRPHATFVVCASRMDTLGAELERARGLLLDDVPEFANCGAR